ncbi:MAG: type VI secretion system tip protein VgrG [Planctomycetes bacterium]|nr:type VI secretion system tip protein VgrG [Planctomycetota bacterium]
MAGIANLAIKFESEAVPPTTLVCTRLVGEERLSSCFRFELELLSSEARLDLSKILYAPARLGLEGTVVGGEGRVFRWYHGALERITELEQDHGLVRYEAVFVPDLRRLADFHRSRVFLDQTIDELVAAVLKADLRLESGQDFDLRLARTGQGEPKERDVYPEREYVVQYEETDLAFLTRWLEREGIFYFFDNDGTREKVVFADAASAYRPAAPGHRFRYRPKGGGETQKTGADEDIVALRCTAARQPGAVVIADWNWRDPGARVVAREDDTPRPGLRHEYNAHVRTPAQAEAHAATRREALDAREQVFEGRGTCRSFRPGRTFALEGHFRADFDDEYVVTAVRHEAEQAVNFEAGVVTSSNYANTFEAVPARRTFRPARATPWPAIKGVIHARIDSAGDGEFADLDDDGGYLVRLPWDLAEAEEDEGERKPAGRASRRVRLAQPYAGPGVGLHFPLRKGTEVLLTHIDGDPDRPVIAAAVPNPHSPSPVDLANHKQNRLHTTSGNAVILDDDPDLAGFVFVDASGGHMRDLRQPASTEEEGGDDGAGGGGGGEPAPAAPWAPPLPRPPSPGLLRAIAGGGRLPPGLAARGGPGGGAGGDPTAAGAAGAKTVLAAYLEAWPDDQELIDTAIDRLTGFDEPAVFDGYKFEADHAESTVKIEAIGSGILIKDGDSRYTLDNVSNTYNYSTSDGYTMNKAEGLQTEDSIHDGDKVETSEHTGDAKSTSTHIGHAIETSTHIGNKLETSTHVGVDFKTETSVGAAQSTTIRLGADQSSELTLGGKDSFSFKLARTTETSITVGGAWKLELTLVAAESNSITLGPTLEHSFNLGPKNSLTVTTGPEFSLSCGLAPKDEHEIVIAPRNKLELTVAVKTETAIVLGYAMELKLNLSVADAITLTLGAKNELGVFVGAKSEINVFAGAQMKIDISASLLLEIAIAAACGLKITIAADGCKEINIPKKQEIDLQAEVVSLQRQITQLAHTTMSTMSNIGP